MIHGQDMQKESHFQASWSVALFWSEEHPRYLCFLSLNGELAASNGYVWQDTHEEVYRAFRASYWRMDTQFHTCTIFDFQHCFGVQPYETHVM